MATALAWVLVLALSLAVARLRRRLELVAEATHELRGPATAITFAVASLRRENGGERRALRLESELERLRVGLADLDAARSGRRARSRPQPLVLEQLVDRAAAGWRAPAGERAIRVHWDAGTTVVQADRGRLSQALGNLMANAVEHGSGPIDVRAVRRGTRSVHVEVGDAGPGRRSTAGRSRADRGHGLAIASRAVREAGGRLTLDRGATGTRATIELPLADGGER
jgi:signal transduction histidine kinase